ncbi:EAL domain-containing protein [Reinekea sp.]|jgi:predicted signal transduction protein with EAL and GGDEF domain|uniref:bifunctional diguanylate cyclase/phosphodiesterase n=1 Tax=Reinekea sp. TaxID=1970455 RepID=UPI002A80F9B5|nr:EAL domain-containing protein [Reinekea sp.]
MTLSFRSQLLLFFISLLGFTLMAELWAVSQAADRATRVNAMRTLAVAERVFVSLLEESHQQQLYRTVHLSEDPAFRRAISTARLNTISSILVSHGQRLGADMVVLLEPHQGDVMTSTHSLASTLPQLREHLQASNEPFSGLVIAEQQPFQLVMVPVLTPNLIAWVGMGFVIDKALVNRFRDISNADISLLYRGDQTAMISSISTTQTPTWTDFSNGSFDQLVGQFERLLNDRGNLSRQRLLLVDDRQQLTLMLSVSLTKAKLIFSDMESQIVLISALGLMLAVFLTVMVARRLTAPINRLVRAAERIGRGDYEQLAVTRGSRELHVLSDTLNNMQRAIADREQHIRYQAQHDLLTGLPNRNQMNELFDQRRLDQPSAHFAVALIKVSNFDTLSDAYGMGIVDQMLQQVGQRFASSPTSAMTLGLIATDEFLLLSESFSSAADDPEQSFSDAVTLGFEQPFQCANLELQCEVRLAMVLCPAHAEQFEDTVRRGRITLAEARRTDQRSLVYDAGQEVRHLRQIKVTRRLQQALVNDGFSLLFQPQYDLKTKRVYSAEALIRWHDEELGAMFPDEFISLAEESGVITQITEWVFTQALEQMVRWQAAGYRIGVSINLSAKDILKDELIDSVIRQLDAHDFERSNLMLEITESALIADAERALFNLQRLYDAGVHLAMDDFGTGYSSLTQLKSMPVHELKIDKSFVMNLCNDKADQQIVRSTIDMAHHLGLSVIAEGVESLAASSLLGEMNCDAIQGYHLSRPIPAKALLAWVDYFEQAPLERLESTT